MQQMIKFLNNIKKVWAQIPHDLKPIPYSLFCFVSIFRSVNLLPGKNVFKSNRLIAWIYHTQFNLVCSKAFSIFLVSNIFEIISLKHYYLITNLYTCMGKKLSSDIELRVQHPRQSPLGLLREQLNTEMTITPATISPDFFLCLNYLSHAKPFF